MKSWVVILWLVFFFPVGIYFMFKHTDWSNIIKYTITSVLTFLTGISIISSMLFELLFISGFFMIIFGVVSFIYSIIKKSDKRKSAAILFIGILFFAFSASEIDAQQQEIIAAEKQEQIAEEKHQEQIAEKKKIEEERKQQELEQKKLDEVKIAVEAAENKPTRENYDKAFTLISTLSKNDSDLEGRIAKVEEIVVSEEKVIKEVTEAIEKAEEDKTRENYDTAVALASTLKVKDDDLEDRLAIVDQAVKDNETKVAEEKADAEEKAKQEKVDADKKADAQKEEQEKAAAEEKESSNSSGSSSSSDNSTPSSTPSGQYVDAQGNGLIKGSSSKIYHVPGSTYYDRTTNPAAWFKTVEEAKAAGYRAPKK